MEATLRAGTKEHNGQGEWQMEIQIPEKPAGTVWSRWYENRNSPNCELLTQPAVEARQQWEITLSKLNLSTKEREGQENIRSPSGFLNYVKQLENKHEAKRKTRSRDKVLENLLSLENFANTYSPVVDAVVAADPSGAVNVIWSVCSVGATIISNKQLTDKSIHESITALEKSLPRLDGYGELYPTDRMINLISDLYAQVMEFLPKVFLYYRQSGWIGSLRRLVSSASDDSFSKFLGRIDQTSRAILEESTIGMSSEIRTTRLVVQETREKTDKLSQDLVLFKKDHQESSLEVTQELESITKELGETYLKVDDMEIAKRKKALNRVKKYLVHMDYDPNRILSAASSQICYGLRQKTIQTQASRALMDRAPLADWLSPNSGATRESKKIIWINSLNSRDLSISQITLEAADALRRSFSKVPEGCSINEGSPIILSSMYQTELPYIACTDTKRTTSTLLKEAIYQLLVHHPASVLKHKTLRLCGSNASGLTEICLEELVSLTCDLLDNFPSGDSEIKDNRTIPRYPANQQSHLRQPIFWIIDRIDECAFSRCQGASKLFDFAKLLEKLVGGPKGRLRVLITSLYPPQRCDPQWASSFEDDEEGLKSWVQCEYGSR